jgi:hypothetical protein
MYVLTGFDLATLKLEPPRWQAETMPLARVARALIEKLREFPPWHKVFT